MMLSKHFSFREKGEFVFSNLMLGVASCNGMSPLCNRSSWLVTNLGVKGGLSSFCFKECSRSLVSGLISSTFPYTSSPSYLYLKPCYNPLKAILIGLWCVLAPSGGEGGSLQAYGFVH